jgi:hypothetical protein
MKSFLKYQGKTSPKLRKAVISGLGDIETLIDVANHGADGGYGEFCYYSDTVAFYKKNKKDIWNMAFQDATEVCSTTMVEMVAGFGCLKDIPVSEVELSLLGRPSEYKTQVFNAMTWYALESVAYDYQSYKDEA